MPRLALISVYDKTGLAPFARALHNAGYSLVSTGGTYDFLVNEAGVPVGKVSDLTGFPEILEGRVKTLHPRIHGGLLARRDDSAHLSELDQHKIDPIDVVVSNLYPFQQTIANPETTLADALENIDIGGPSMLRAAAKNFPSVTVVCDPFDYGWIADKLAESGLSTEDRRRLAHKAFRHVSDYDNAVASYLAAADTPAAVRHSRADGNPSPSTLRHSRAGGNPSPSTLRHSRADGNTSPSTIRHPRADGNTSPATIRHSRADGNPSPSTIRHSRADGNPSPSTLRHPRADGNPSPSTLRHSRADGNPSLAPARLPSELNLTYNKLHDLRYGENPHQQAALYQASTTDDDSTDQLLHGKALSFNNIVDADAAWRVVSDFDETTVAVIKHTNPCGLASHPDQKEAYARAFQGDTVSAYGGIVGFNSIVEESTAQAMRGVFYEVVIAPGYSPEALALLKRRKNLRVIQRSPTIGGETDYDLRPVTGGLLVQTPDVGREDASAWKIVTERTPTDAEMHDLEFAWKAAKYVKSNAIVLAKGQALIGMGAGQPNRVTSIFLALRAAGDKATGSVLASDAFFPFSDNVITAAEGGVTAIIQPGGSIRDQDSIDAANERGLAMVFTGTRHFRH